MTIEHLTVRLDYWRRIRLFPEDGMTFDRYVDGIGWVNADDDDWPDVTDDDTDRLREFARHLFHDHTVTP